MILTKLEFYSADFPNKPCSQDISAVEELDIVLLVVLKENKFIKENIKCWKKEGN
jgi:hypothetical protein